ncbi:flagellin [Anaerobiospirillum sp. NML120449]|uniref:flagellin N-terminal helical domain-containing protein n=1 Tax=Anaerobiospirillum sp. NML120449 TaxID=2932817 RepID=UPI001FF5A39A|nr:flagellin [Anaerobiospirillum sp. NML120449]MCK0527517.1 flagellin [Anaerobiospirillum sp. NML120449]
MALFVNTNVSSINTQNKLNINTVALNTSYQRLSSGLRINTAEDDAAGLQISEQLTTQIKGLDQGNRNSDDGIGFLQTVDGAVDEIVTSLQTARTKLVQAANGTNSKNDLAALKTELDSLFLHASAIATDTTYGGEKILMGYQKAQGESIYEAPSANAGNYDPGKLRLQVGANSGTFIDARIEHFFLPEIINTLKPNGGRDTVETLSKGAFTVQKDANGKANAMTFKMDSQEDARNALAVMDYIIGEIDSRRGDVGSYMNRLESTMRNHSNVSSNHSDVRSRMRDTDFAAETANLTQTNILQQSAQTILSQANQRPSLAISLLN